MGAKTNQKHHPVAVKLLDWDGQLGVGIIGKYHVEQLPNGKWIISAPNAALPTQCVFERYGSEFAAKEGANADYARVIRSALPEPHQ